MSRYKEVPTHGFFTKGLACENVSRGIREKERAEKRKTTDTQNRINILEKMKERVALGENIENVARELAQDQEILSQFEYLTKNGLNIEKVFIDMYNSYMKNREKSINIDKVR